MTIEFSLSARQKSLKDMVGGFGRSIIRPQSLQWDLEHAVPEAFLARFVEMAQSMGGASASWGVQGLGAAADAGDVESSKIGDAPSKKKSSAMVTSCIGAEELAWSDAALLLCLPGPGLGGPPVRGSATPEQKERFFGPFKDMSKGLKWAAYGLTEPNAGSDVAGIRTSCRKDGRDWILNGRKCFITNGARASWTVIFATIDPTLGRAGHRAFVVEKGTPGFSVGRIEDKMGLRASETAELVLEDCRVPEANLLGGEERYQSKEGFLTAMKTFDNTRPLVAAMAIGIGRAAYDYACDFVKENYALARHTARYTSIAEKLARIGRRLEAARLLTWRAAFLADEGQPNAKEASMSKASAGQAAIAACIEAIEICGAEGSIAKDHQLLEKWFRDIKVYDIFEGTGQIQRIVISKRLFPDLKAF
jgi:acyl-CoA dehydrogenase